MNPKPVNKFSLLIYIFLLVGGQAFSQKTISLAEEKIPIADQRFQITSVSASIYKSAPIGSYFTEKFERKSIFLQNDIISSVERFIKNGINSTSNSTKIRYEIRKLEISESKKNDREINGKVQFEVAYYLSTQENPTPFTTYATELTYFRTSNLTDNARYEMMVKMVVKKSLEYLNNWLIKNGGVHEAFVKQSKIIILPDILTEDEDTLCYGKRELSWLDFKAKPNASSRYSGTIFSGFGYLANYTIQNQTLVAKVKMKTYMVKGMSWIKPESKTPYSLSHENHHFMITKYVSEQFKKKIANFQADNLADLQSMIQLQYLDSYREMNRLQEQYDAETQHGIISSKQAEWERKIDGWLQK